RDMSIRKLIRLLETKKITGAPVVDDEGNLIGIISEKDIVVAIEHLIKVYVSLDEQKEMRGKYNWVEGVMSRKVMTVDEDADCAEAFRLMSEKRFHRLPVVRDGKLVGIISSMDACRLLSDPEALDRICK
ncbi:CBS domain-containing protein, partial [candidate division KSB1 bacterium]